VLALRLPGGGELTRRELDGWQDFAKARGAKGLAWAVMEPEGTLRSPLAKFLRPEEVKGLLNAAEAEPGDVLFFAAGETRAAQELLAGGAGRAAPAARAHPRRPLGLRVGHRVPAVQLGPERQRWDAEHHPFTPPDPASSARLEQAPGAALSRAYDLILNGAELGGGSIRISDRALQARVFALLGISEPEAEEKFGFLLRGLSYGAPPHGGIAFGLDRLAMLLGGGSSLRDAIAFPKTQSGADPLTAAPKV